LTDHRAVNPRTLLTLCGPGMLALLVLGMPSGVAYAPLSILLVLAAAFFYPPRRASLHIGWTVLALAAAMFVRYPVATAAEFWVLLTGALVAAGVTVGFMRARLGRMVEQEQLARAEVNAFFDYAPAGFGFLDRDLRHLHVNRALAEIMELEPNEIVGRTLPEAAPVNGMVLEPLARRVLETGEPVLGIEVASPNGRQHHIVSYYPVPGPAGTIGVGTAVTDVTHLKHVERRLEDTNRSLTVLATTDELTRLPNRRMFGEQLDLALARARRGGFGVALLCLDLDRFKEVNDTLGHAYGDQLLVEVAARLRAGARDTDVVARVGGDEFVILLADLDVQDAPVLAQTVVERIAGLLSETLAIGPVELKVDASVGVAIYPLDSRDAKGLLAVADAAMYAGKTTLARIA
jgi:diguanylate cyclase (GGDEF)-like protein/PAS domain S-box-containing protein